MATSCPMKKFPCNLSATLVRPRRSPPPLAVVSVSTKDLRLPSLKALRLNSSFAKVKKPRDVTSSFPKVKKPRDVTCFYSGDEYDYPHFPNEEGDDDLNFTEWRPTGKSLYTSIIMAVYYINYIIISKHLLNAFPYPWLISMSYLATASFSMLFCWQVGLWNYELPDTDLNFWKSLFPVAVFHTIGLVAATVSLSKLSLSLYHSIRCLEPVFIVVLSALWGEKFDLFVYFPLLNTIIGCMLSIGAQQNFNITGFKAAMIANLAFAARNRLSKKGIKMKGDKATQVDYYACLSMLSLLILTPFAFAIEGPELWATGWETAAAKFGADHLIWLIVGQSVFYQAYNVDAFRFFPKIQPFQFVCVNTLKKILGFVCCITAFGTPVHIISILGAFVAILGVYCYSREICRDPLAFIGLRNARKINNWFL